MKLTPIIDLLRVPVKSTFNDSSGDGYPPKKVTCSPSFSDIN